MYFSKFFWRFFPDLLVAGSACVITGTGWLRYKYGQPRPESGGVGDGPDIVLWWIGIPFVTTIYVWAVCLAKNSARLNFSRFIFESPPFIFMGFCSYPMYLLQAIFFQYYTPEIYYEYNTKDPSGTEVYHPVTAGERPRGGLFKGRFWFANLHYGIKIADCAILFIICWFIQKYVQGKLVSQLYSAAYEWSMRKVSDTKRDKKEVEAVPDSALVPVSAM